MKAITKDNLLFDCKLFASGKRDANHPACKECSKKYGDQFNSCRTSASATKATKATKAKTEKTPSRIPGYWGYTKSCYTDLFCEAICERPMTMNECAAIYDLVTKQPIGPHPKAKARLIADNLAVFDGHRIYMRVWPKNHPMAGQLTPAAKTARSKSTDATDATKKVA